VIDWFTGDLPIDASNLSLDHIIEVSRHGEKIYDIEKWLQVEGSYSSSIQLRRANPSPGIIDWCKSYDITAPQSILQFSGNPTKWLQGQNCYGPVYDQLLPVMSDVVDRLPSDIRVEGIQGPVETRRIDLTIMVDLESHNRVHEWLRQAADRSRSRHGRPLVSGSTVYWGSKHGWGLKAYCKYCELEAHPFMDLKLNKEFQKAVETQLRLELTLRTRELKEHEQISEDLVWSYFDRVELGMMKSTTLLNGGDLPISSLMVYRAWLEGYPVVHELKKRQMYRHRRRILDEVGVDICSSPVGIRSSTAPIIMDQEYLHQHEVKDVPDVFKPYMWRPWEESDLDSGFGRSGAPALKV